MGNSKLIKKSSVAILTATIMTSSVTPSLNAFAEEEVKKEAKAVPTSAVVEKDDKVTEEKDDKVAEEKDDKVTEEKETKPLSEFKNGSEVTINEKPYIVLDNSIGLIAYKEAIDYIPLQQFIKDNLGSAYSHYVMKNKVDTYVTDDTLNLMSKYKDKQVEESSLENIGISKETTNLNISYISASNFLSYNSENGLKNKFLTIDTDTNYILSDKLLDESNNVKDKLAYSSTKEFKPFYELGGKNKTYVTIQLDVSKAQFDENATLVANSEIDEKTITEAELKEPVEIVNENTLATTVVTPNTVVLPEETYNNVLAFATSSNTSDFITNVDKDIKLQISTEEKGEQLVEGHFNVDVNGEIKAYQVQPMKVVNKFSKNDKSSKIEKLGEISTTEVKNTEKYLTIDLAEYFSSNGDFEIEVLTEATEGGKIAYAVEDGSKLVIFNNLNKEAKNLFKVIVKNKKGDAEEASFEVATKPYLKAEEDKTIKFKDVKSKDKKETPEASEQYQIIYDTTINNLSDSNINLLNEYLNSESDAVKELEESKISALDLIKNRLDVLKSSADKKEDFNYLEKATKEIIAEIEDPKAKKKLKSLSNVVSEVTKLKLASSSEVDSTEQLVKALSGGTVKDDLLSIVEKFKFINLVKDSGKLKEESLSSIEGFDKKNFKVYKKALIALSKDSLSSFSLEDVSNLVSYVNLKNEANKTEKTNIEALTYLDKLPNSTYKFDERIDLIAELNEDKSEHILTDGFNEYVNNLVANLNSSDIEYVSDFISTEDTYFEAEYKGFEEATKYLNEYFISVLNNESDRDAKVLAQTALLEIPDSNTNKYKIENLFNTLSMADFINNSISEEALLTFDKKLNSLEDGAVKDALSKMSEEKKIKFILENSKDIEKDTLTNLLGYKDSNKDFNLKEYKKLFKTLNDDSFKSEFDAKNLELFVTYLNQKLDTKDSNAYNDLNKSLESVPLSDYKLLQIAENREAKAELDSKKELTIVNSKEENKNIFDTVKNINLIGKKDEKILNLSEFFPELNTENFTFNVSASSENVISDFDKESMNLKISSKTINSLDTVTVDVLDNNGKKYSMLIVVSSLDGYSSTNVQDDLKDIHLESNKTYAVNLDKALKDVFPTNNLKNYNISVKDIPNPEQENKDAKDNSKKASENKESFWSKIVNWVKGLFGKGESASADKMITYIDLEKETNNLPKYLKSVLNVEDKSVSLAIINDTLFIQTKEIGNKTITVSGITDANLTTEDALLDIYVEKPSEFKSNEELLKADTEKADTEKTDTEKADTEKADTEKADTEKADTEKADTEKADTEKAEK